MAFTLGPGTTGHETIEDFGLPIGPIWDYNGCYGYLFSVYQFANHNTAIFPFRKTMIDQWMGFLSRWCTFGSETFSIVPFFASQLCLGWRLGPAFINQLVGKKHLYALQQCTNLKGIPGWFSGWFPWLILNLWRRGASARFPCCSKTCGFQNSWFPIRNDEFGGPISLSQIWIKTETIQPNDTKCISIDIFLACVLSFAAPMSANAPVLCVGQSPTKKMTHVRNQMHWVYHMQCFVYSIYSKYIYIYMQMSTFR